LGSSIQYYAGLVLQAVQEVVRPKLWGVKTHNLGDEEEGHSLSLQVWYHLRERIQMLAPFL
jgi:hypothetical protein